MRATRVAVFVPPVRDWQRWWELCVDLCRSRGYEVHVIVTGPAADWEQVKWLVDEGRVDKVVVGQPHHVPPVLPAWVESVEE
jgi:hypothetical protein